MSELEAKIEKSLINQLTSGVSQWTYRPDIKTDAQLWANFRDKLNKNNLGVLNGVEITDGEMQQIKDYMLENSSTSYKAALWLAGEHGISQIPLVREDASLGQINLMALNNREIAGGRSSYEVINQFLPETGERERRFDVSLLINGIPLIHIELKNPDHPYMDAFRQIQNYCREGQFRSLFGFVQMFVVSNEAETRYIAANTTGDMGEKFLTRWVDEDNQTVNSCLEFAKVALNIPMAHLMIGRYSVIDEANKRQVLLRPYQIHAISKIREASKENKSGYVWHTTGSGKTLTSYTVTKNLLDIPSIDKAIFLIDRRDLDKQTSDSFQSYAHNDDVDVDKTESTKDLENKLCNKEKTAIVTTIQKMQNIIRKCSAKNLSEPIAKLKKQLQSKRLAFVIDECHRTVSPQTKRELGNFFGSFEHPCLWYGFTGTPIFAENQREMLGDLPRTTLKLYERELHKYTIKEALHDGAVLGFQIQSLGNGLESLQELARENKLFSEEKIFSMSQEELEDAVVGHYEKNGKSLYSNSAHREKVVDYIINKSGGKLNLVAGEGNTFEGILTCSSIKEAQAYYKLFKQFKAENKVKESILSRLPDFPKVAITYTVGENEDGADVNKEAMKESLEDYKKMFPDAPASLDELGAYNADLNKRLARKESRYRTRDQQLDLVIVVDRLLTGFDAPCLSTIFLDRPPMKPQHLIQAFSRTNRIFTPVKRYGQIVTMQFPASYARKIDEALVLYSSGGTAEVSAPSWKETKTEFKKAVKVLKEIAPSSDKAGELTDLEDLKEFVRAYQAVDRAFSSLQVYDEFEEDKLQEQFGITREKIESYVGFYKNALEIIGGHDPIDPKEPPILVDFDYRLESVKFFEVNYKYLMELIQSHIPECDGEAVARISEKEEKRVSKYIELYKKQNPGIGSIVEQIWADIKNSPHDFTGKNAFEIVERKLGEKILEKLEAFSESWAVTMAELNAVKDAWDGLSAIELTGNYPLFKEKGNKQNKLRYKKELREAANKMFKEEIGPLTRF